MIGNVGVGGDNPIRIQSMTTTNTMDTLESVKQSIKLIEHGCELVRLTAPSIKDAKNLFNIKNKLIQKGYDVPLIADIHFTPNAALEAAKIVEKVRINPGNYTDKKRFQTTNYSKSQYQEELKRIEEKLFPLIEVCRDYGTAMRIGTNHGSLSDRILSQYGDTPLGMVESALEFVRICEKHNYSQIILSMKASNPIVMTHAYRLLVYKMKQANMSYPIHLGVTEAGEGQEGRVKSAIGIGSLLMDGIGDTIRVSLTESPENEIDPAKKIVNSVKKIYSHRKILANHDLDFDPFLYSRRNSRNVLNIGKDHPPIVMADLSMRKQVGPNSLVPLGYRYSAKLDKWHINDAACDYIFMGNKDLDFELPGYLRPVFNYEKWILDGKGYPVLSKKNYLTNSKFSSYLNFIRVSEEEITKSFCEKIKKDKTAVLLFSTKNIHSVGEWRAGFLKLINQKVYTPIIIYKNYQNVSNREEFPFHASIDLGSLLLDGLGDGLAIFFDQELEFNKTQLAFNILQATRTRISKTEYISCPSCGRTLFDLESTTAKIRAATGHLKGLKIGVMGCIVNGPGEMADADYGYVGTGPGKISLYKEKNVIKKNIPTEKAIEELIKIIKENGDWID